MWHFVEPHTPPSECHVLFEWPLRCYVWNYICNSPISKCGFIAQSDSSLVKKIYKYFSNTPVVLYWVTENSPVIFLIGYWGQLHQLSGTRRKCNYTRVKCKFFCSIFINRILPHFTSATKFFLCMLYLYTIKISINLLLQSCL